MTTPNFELPFPTLGDLPNGPAAFQNLAEAVDAALEQQAPAGVQVRAKRVDAATGPDGFATITAAQMGLATVAGAVASLSWELTNGGTHWCTARISGNSIQVLVFSTSSLAGGTVARVENKAVAFNVVAWGTA